MDFKENCQRDFEAMASCQGCRVGKSESRGSRGASDADIWNAVFKVAEVMPYNRGRRRRKTRVTTAKGGRSSGFLRAAKYKIYFATRKGDEKPRL